MQVDTIEPPAANQTLMLMSEGLAQTAERLLRARYAERGHDPSPAQWAAIADLLWHLEKAADGELDASAAYVSAIPAGCGKSTSLQAFATALATRRNYCDVGMLIAANRVEEVGDIADGLQSIRDRVHVVCSDRHPDVIAKGGHSLSDTAQIVVTTQEALRRSLKTTGDFGSIRRFHYIGRRRAVIAWDETIAMNRGVCLDADTVAMLSRAVGRQSPDARDALLRWSADLGRVPDKALFPVPDFGALDLDFDRLEQDATDDLVAAVKALAILSGGQGFVVKDNWALSSSMVMQVPELPVSLLPVIVTDASAAEGVNHVLYQQMARDSRYRVEPLRTAPKTYSNLALRIVPVAASRSVFRQQKGHPGRDLIDMTVRHIRSVAPAEMLIVSYKGNFKMRGVSEQTIEGAIRARLTRAESERVSYMTWGAHTSSNEHWRTEHVVLLGLHFRPKAAAHAASGAALGRSMRSNDPSDHPTAEHVDEMREGMLRDATLQAILRGHARVSVGSDCGPMTALVFQSPQTGLSRGDWLGMFPKVDFRQDTTLLPMKPLRGNLKALSEAVQRKLDAGDHEMTDATLYGELQMDRSNYGRLTRRKEWTAWLLTMGLHKAKLAGGSLGLRRASGHVVISS